MRKYLLVIANAMLLSCLAAYALARAPSAEGAKYEVPGIGVKFALPAGVRPPLLGSMFVSDDRAIRIVVDVSSIELPGENLAALERTFPGPAVPFHSGTLDGKLRSRPLVAGHGWGGWWLTVDRGKQKLGFMISYQGEDPAKLDQLKPVLSTISWDGRTADSEIAFGAKFEVPGLQLVAGRGGALLYTANGSSDWHQPFIYLMAQPSKVEGDQLRSAELCKLAASKILKGKSTAAPRYAETKEIRMCDVFGGTTEEGVNYYAIVAFPDGAAFHLLGQGDPDVIRKAIQKGRRLPKN